MLPRVSGQRIDDQNSAYFNAVVINAVIIAAVVSEYCDHTPLFRLAAILVRGAGLEIGRATLDGWVTRVARGCSWRRPSPKHVREIKALPAFHKGEFVWESGFEQYAE